MMIGRHPIEEPMLHRLTADPGPWLSCDDCFRLLDQFVESALSGGLEALNMPAMRNHLTNCRACREEAVTLVTLAAEDSGIDQQEALARAGLA
jgi:hypothetical protein